MTKKCIICGADFGARGGDDGYMSSPPFTPQTWPVM